MGNTATLYAQCFKMNVKEKALAAVKSSFEKTGVSRPYEVSKIVEASTFDEVAEYLGWGVILQNPTNPTSPISGIEFLDEKIHEEVATQFFKAIEGFVAIGCFVYVRLDSGVFFNWDFEENGVVFSEN